MYTIYSILCTIVQSISGYAYISLDINYGSIFMHMCVYIYIYVKYTNTHIDVRLVT